MFRLYLTQSKATALFESLTGAKEVAKSSKEWYYIANEVDNVIEYTQDDEIYEIGRAHV